MFMPHPMMMGMFGMGFPGGANPYDFYGSTDYLKSPPKIKFHENPIRFEYSNYKIRPQEVSSFTKSGNETPMFMPPQPQNKIYNMVFQENK